MTFTPNELSVLQDFREKRRLEWHAKVEYLNAQIERGIVQLPRRDAVLMASFAAVKTAPDGILNLATLDDNVKMFANAVWDAGIKVEGKR